jgi:hypothetical protein
MHGRCEDFEEGDCLKVRRFVHYTVEETSDLQSLSRVNKSSRVSFDEAIQDIIH